MRKTLDKLISWTGLLLAAVLLVAGGLLTWASTFINTNVTDQLSAQHITMPTAQAIASMDQADKDALTPFVGQELENGDQAKAYADHYILVHMNEASEGKTYSEVSGQFLKLSNDPNADQAEVQKLGDLRQTLFMGSTLRGLLLYGYAFATMGKIAGIAAIVSFVGAAVFLVLGLMGLRHARTATDTVVPAQPERVPAHS
jgi:hypothetical protein